MLKKLSRLVGAFVLSFSLLNSTSALADQLQFSREKYNFDVDCIVHNAGKAMIEIDIEGNNYRIQISGGSSSIFAKLYSNASFRMEANGKVVNEQFKPDLFTISERHSKLILLGLLFPSSYKKRIEFDYLNQLLKVYEKNSLKGVKMDSCVDPLSAILSFLKIKPEKDKEYFVGRVYGEDYKDLYARVLEDEPFIVEVELPKKTLIKGETKLRLAYTRENNIIDIKNAAIYVPHLKAWAEGKLKD